jgi:hypothetical protein
LRGDLFIGRDGRSTHYQAAQLYIANPPRWWLAGQGREWEVARVSVFQFWQFLAVSAIFGNFSAFVFFMSFVVKGFLLALCRD